MADGDRDMGVPTDDGTVALAIEESRRTMDKQISAIEQIDEKGDRTARFSILILGFTSSALAVGGPGALDGTHPVTAGLGFVGVILLFAAAIAGNATASQTNIPLGAGERFGIAHDGNPETAGKGACYRNTVSGRRSSKRKANGTRAISGERRRRCFWRCFSS